MGILCLHAFLSASGAKLCEALKEALGKPRDWVAVDVGRALAKVQGSLEKFLPMESWPPTLAVGQSLDRGSFDLRYVAGPQVGHAGKSSRKKGRVERVCLCGLGRVRLSWAGACVHCVPLPVQVSASPLCDAGESFRSAG